MSLGYRLDLLIPGGKEVGAVGTPVTLLSLPPAPTLPLALLTRRVQFPPGPREANWTPWDSGFTQQHTEVTQAWLLLCKVQGAPLENREGAASIGTVWKAVILRTHPLSLHSQAANMAWNSTRTLICMRVERLWVPHQSVAGSTESSLQLWRVLRSNQGQGQ